MRDSTSRLGGTWLALLALTTPGVTVAQAPFTFEFDPTAGLSMRLAVEMQVEIVFVGIPDLPDSSVAEVFSLGGVTWRAVPDGRGSFVLRVSYDSLRTRHRVGGTGSWRVGRLASDSAIEAVFVADRYLRLSGPTYFADPAATERAMHGTGMPHFVLPADPVDPGGSWRSETTLPFAVEIPGGTTGLVTAMLAGPAVGLLDSLVTRGSDTLAYLSARGQFVPTTDTTSFEVGGAPALAESWGDFAARLIWSTGWNAFVSVVLTARVNQRFEAAEDGALEEPRVTATFTTRVRVRN